MLDADQIRFLLLQKAFYSLMASCILSLKMRPSLQLICKRKHFKHSFLISILKYQIQSNQIHSALFRPLAVSHRLGCSQLQLAERDTAARTENVWCGLTMQTRCIMSAKWRIPGVFHRSMLNIDIDECEGNNPCDRENEICVNIPGSFRCTVRSGFRMAKENTVQGKVHN